MRIKQYNKIFFNYILECTGAVTFSSIEQNHGYTMLIDASDIHDKRRKKRKVRKENPDTGELLRFEVVTMQGNCDWKVWNAYIGGSSHKVDSIGAHQPGWQILSVKLMS